MLLTFKKQFVGRVLRGLYSTELELRTWLKNNNPRLLNREGETRLQELVEKHVEAYLDTFFNDGKTATIRAYRKKRPFQITDRLDMYSASRTADAMKIGEMPAGQWLLSEIEITEDNIVVDGHQMSERQLATICRRDGFQDMAAFRAFFRKEHGLPFSGQYLTWNRA